MQKSQNKIIMGKKKTNIDYLRDILDKDLKKYDESSYDEAIEFLEAIEKEVEDLKESEQEAKDEAGGLQRELQEIEDDKEYSDIIHAGIGDIEFKADNLALKGVMEALDSALQKTPPVKIEKILEAL